MFIAQLVSEKNRKIGFKLLNVVTVWLMAGRGRTRFFVDGVGQIFSLPLPSILTQRAPKRPTKLIYDGLIHILFKLITNFL